ERDRKVIEAAVALAKRRSPATDVSVFDFLQDVLLMRAGDATEEGRAEQCRFGMKFQQLTGPVMAKGLEDTAFYRYNRLTSLNEVGGDPTQFGLSVATFHRQSADRRKRWSHALLASSTHDTKRSEDVRARIDVLSELPREWRAAINRWTRMNRRHKTKVEGVPAPDRNDEYVLYQTLLGAWPFDHELEDPAAYPAFVDRMEAFLLKAIREAQVHTSWVNPNAAYDEATSRFVRAVLDNSAPNPFLGDIAAVRRRVAHAGTFNALGQHLLKLTAPGVPDIYQGTELWNLSLVDPDNRRPVDYDRRRALLRDLSARRDDPSLPAELVTAVDDGRIKLFVSQRVLARRATQPELFTAGDYLPLDASGPKQDHVVAFARRAGDREIVVVVPRLIAGLTRGEAVPPVGDTLWAGTSLTIPGAADGHAYRNLFTGDTVRPAPGSRGGEIALAEALATFPVAVLERLPSAPAAGTDPSSS
ncbi:MAG: malto-oligosyltrehalose synthase, partial [Chloroflexota bacterium]|nr:malto-oligosyltrehalose synthase [Chloroflexota bacterium]